MLALPVSGARSRPVSTGYETKLTGYSQLTKPDNPRGSWHEGRLDGSLFSTFQPRESVGGEDQGLTKHSAGEPGIYKVSSKDGEDEHGFEDNEEGITEM